MTQALGMVDRRQVRTTTEAIPGPRFIPRKVVAKKLGVSIETLRQMVDSGSFPGPISVHRQAHLWLASEVDDWIWNTYYKQRQPSE